MNLLNEKSLVTKSNNLVEARYHFSIWETRVFTKLVSLIQPTDKDLHNYRLHIKDLVQFFGLNDKDAYAKIKEVPENLLKKVVTIPYTNKEGEVRFLKTGLIAQATIPEKREGYIELAFHPTLKPYLLELQQTFLSYDIRNVLKISSVYSIRIYELLKQYEAIGIREFDLIELKQILGISEKYKLYGHFKDRIISKAQKDLNEYTDILFDFKEKKKGRKVIGLIFSIYPNKKNEKSLDNRLLLPEDKRLRKYIKEHLEKWGIDSNREREIFNSYGVEHIEKAVKYVWNQQESKHKRGVKIENPGAYFLRIIASDNLVDTIAQEDIERKKSHEHKIVLQKKRKALFKKIEVFQKDQQNAEQALIKQLFKEEKGRMKALLNVVKNDRASFYDKTLSEEENIQQRPFFRTYFYKKVKQEFAVEFKEISTSFKPKIEQVKKELQLLS
jgi:plasmid replication initiation protein